MRKLWISLFSFTWHKGLYRLSWSSNKVIILSTTNTCDLEIIKVFLIGTTLGSSTLALTSLSCIWCLFSCYLWYWLPESLAHASDIHQKLRPLLSGSYVQLPSNSNMIEFNNKFENFFFEPGYDVVPRMKISVIMDILVLRCYEYIRDIWQIFWKKISIDLKLIKIH